MSYNHTLSQIAIRFMVGYRGYNKTVILHKTSMGLKLVKLLYQQGLILSFSLNKDSIIVELKYNRGQPLWKYIKVISTPGHRAYWSLRRLRLAYSSKNFGGVYIISTPQGLYTSTECLLALHKVGEVLLKIQLA